MTVVHRHGDYHQAMGFVVSFLMLFLDDRDILKIVCVPPPQTISRHIFQAVSPN
jgi:hypothetical protein